MPTLTIRKATPADTAAITADYVDGVLKLTLPKEQSEEKPAKRQIAIGGGAPALTE